MSFLSTLANRGPFRPHPNRQKLLFLAALFAIAAGLGALTVALTPWKIFALIVSVLCVVISIYRPEIIVLCLAIYAPFEPFLLKFVSDDIYLYARYFSRG